MRSRRRRARIAASSAGLLVVASLGAPALSEADRRDANGRLAPAPLHVLEARNGGGSLTAGADWSRDPGRVVDLLGVAEAPRLRWQAVMQNAARLETGAIGGRFVACSGTVASVQVSVEGGGAQSALSGPTGAFELKDVPPGTFDLIVEAGGQRATISGIRVVSGRTTDIGEINLTDFGADPKHCGACGKRCPPGASCVYGVCICPAGLMVCGDTCTTLADLEHCRACQNRCAAWPNMIPQCGAQDCVYRCVDGTADCDGRRTTGCEIRIDSDVNNCGACGNSCAPGQRCVKSRCQ